MDILSAQIWTQYNNGNICYELKDIPKDINEHIPFESLLEELENFIQTIEISKSFSEIHQSMHESGDLEEVEEQFQNIEDNIEDNNQGFFDMDHCFAKTFDYDENYTVKDLQKIADYYDISYRKLCKSELIEQIVSFEDEAENFERIQMRKRMWFYMKKIKQDKKLKQFLIFDSPILN